MISRRQFLGAGVAGLVGTTYGPILRRPGSVVSAAAAADQKIILTTVVVGTGQYQYLPFDVAPGVNRVAVTVEKSGPGAVGAGLFDERGTGYQGGFRGIYGEERPDPAKDGGTFFVAAHAASQSFIPGPIRSGRWNVIIPVFNVPAPMTVTCTVTLTFGPEQAAFVPGPEQGVVSPTPGWYRGDLHCHTPESSDAWKSGSAMTPAQWAAETARLGMNFVAMTDHNVVSQNFALADAASSTGVLLMAGEEMTNWFHGHATVSGIPPDAWLDWRQTPFGTPLPSGGGTGATIADFTAKARELGGYVSAAHPSGGALRWDFFPDGEANPQARTDGIEVWTGQYQPDDEATMVRWDDLLRRGWRIFANGGSDLHGIQNNDGFAAGTPTTVVYARELSKAAIVEALRLGRSYVTRRPDGVETYLTATGPGGQRQIVGGSIHGEPGDVAEVSVLVRRAAGMRLILLRDGSPVSTTVLSADEETVRSSVPVGSGGYVRAEVRDRPFIDPLNPRAGRLDMEAFTNPIFLVAGPPPPGGGPVDAPPPVIPEAPFAAALPLAGAAVAAGSAALHRRRSRSPGPMTLTELKLRAACGEGLENTVRVVGQVTANEITGVVLTRWVGGCCPGEDEPVSIAVTGASDAAVGDWLQVDGRWEHGSTGLDGPLVRLHAQRWRPLDDPPPRREA